MKINIPITEEEIEVLQSIVNNQLAYGYLEEHGKIFENFVNKILNQLQG